MAENIIRSTYDDLWRIPDVNKPLQLNSALYKELYDKNEIYEIDLNTRRIFGPESLSCQHDHNAELILFSVDRYYGTLDLADTCCIVQFKTVDKYGDTFLGIYPIRFYDTLTAYYEGKILIPWTISHAVTQTATTIEYNVRFYSVEEVKVQNNLEEVTQYRLDFNLSTLPATAQVLSTLDIDDDQIETAYTSVVNQFTQSLDNYNYLVFLDRIKEIYEKQILYWENASDLL